MLFFLMFSIKIEKNDKDKCKTIRWRKAIVENEEEKGVYLR